MQNCVRNPTGMHIGGDYIVITQYDIVVYMQQTKDLINITDILNTVEETIDLKVNTNKCK